MTSAAPGRTASVLRRGGSTIQVAGSQLGLAASNYAVLAIASRQLDHTGYTALAGYYLLINTVGRGLFAAVELETTRAVAAARAAGVDDGPARRTALRHTALLLGVAAVLLGLSTPLLARIMGSGLSAVVLLAIGAVGMAASYLLRGPLAGAQRYGLYASTFWIEAAVGLAAAGALVVLGNHDATLWIGVLALAPLVAAAVLARPAGRIGGTAGGRPGSTTRALVWSAALLLAGQGLWNLAPFVVSARLADPSVAAGFLSAAVILRAPVLLFPTIQALLLPMFTTMAATGDDDALRRTVRRIGGLLVVAGAVWIAIGVLVVPTVSRIVFNAAYAPPAWMLAALAASTIVGAAAQIGQTHLVAVRRPAAAASGWIAGLVVLLAIALLAAPALDAATVGQVLGAVVVLVVLTLMRPRHAARP